MNKVGIVETDVHTFRLKHLRQSRAWTTAEIEAAGARWQSLKKRFRQF